MYKCYFFSVLIFTQKSNLFSSSKGSFDIPEDIVQRAMNETASKTVDVITAATSPKKKKKKKNNCDN